jgi:ACS family tartrate transporter-like MFS transporter
LQMNQDLGLTQTQFGLAAGFFAIGVLVFGVPSTLLLHRLGARRWISATLLAWGILSAATAFVRSPAELFGARLLLGVAEAGFIPGAILYYSYWFPAAYRGRVIASFIFMQPVGLIVGAPLSGLLLSHGLFGLMGWQSMFIVEALPTLILAVAVYLWLPDRPEQARWLSGIQKQWLGERLAAEAPSSERGGSLRRAVSDTRVLGLSLAYLAIGTSGAGAIYFIPLMIHSMHFSTLETGLLAAAPPAAAAALLPLWGRWTDRHQRAEFTTVIASGIMAAGLLMSACLLPSPGAITGLCIAMIGFFGLMPAFWSLPTRILRGADAATATGLISVVGNLGNFSGPFLLGRLSDITKTYGTGLVCLAAVSCGAVAVLGVSASKSPSA